jgi:Fe-S-cluster containining protein
MRMKARRKPPSQRPHRKAAVARDWFDEVLEDSLRAEYLSAREILSEGRIPEKLDEAAANAQGWAEDCVGVVGNALGIQPDCLGCNTGWCCHQPVYIAMPEAVRIALFLRERLSSEELTVLTERVRAAAKALEGLTTPEARLQRHTCPLLMDGRCSVYEVRPVTCRAYWSLDREKCRRAAEDPSDQTYTVPVYGVRHAGAVYAGLLQALRENGYKSHPVFLPTALLRELFK